MRLRSKKPKFRNFIRARKGVTLAEYMVLVAILSISVIVSVAQYGSVLENTFERSRKTLSSYLSSGKIIEDEVSLPVLSELSPCPTDPRYAFDIEGLATTLEANLWNPLANGTGADQKRICVDPGGAVDGPTPSAPWAWTWEARGNSQDVVGYPEVVFGQKPWSNSGAAPNAAAIDAREITLDFAYEITDEASVYNVAASTWLTSAPEAQQTRITDEVMIWLGNSGMTPAGDMIGLDLDIDGATFDLWRKTGMTDASGSHPQTWNYYAFVARNPVTTGQIRIDAFLSFLADAHLVEPDRYTSSVEFGTEIVDGKGALKLKRLSVSGLEPEDVAIGNFSFPPTTVAYDHSGPITSDYLDIPGLEGKPREFSLTASSPDLSPRAISNVVGQGDGSSGKMHWGTTLQVDAPKPGETAVVMLDVAGGLGTWRIARDPAPEPARPAVGNFDFGTVRLAWDDPSKRVYSAYVDIPGLEGDPVAFEATTDTGAGHPRAESNVMEGPPATTGTLTWGTNLSVEAPEPGETVVASLTLGGKSGTFRVSRDPAPSCPTLVLTQNNHKNHAQVNYSAQGVAQLERPFTLTGTGKSNPRAQSNSYSSGTDTSGMTAKWGLNIQNDKLKKGQSETITLTICGNTISWQVGG